MDIVYTIMWLTARYVETFVCKLI